MHPAHSTGALTESAPSVPHHRSRTPVESTHRVDQIYQFIHGINSEPVVMDNKIKEELHDPFMNLLLKQGILPLSLSQLLQALEATKTVKERKIFHIAEGGQIPWSNMAAKLNRSFRLAIYIETSHNEDDIYISTGINVNSLDDFLQLMAWDNTKKGFNFYERRGTWIYAGNSRDSLHPNTRGLGPFSGHVNGSPVMKELESPWSHWHSSEAEISEEVFSKEDPFVKSSFFEERKKADSFEKIVKAGISRWNTARIENSDLCIPPYFMRQILDTTTINLRSLSKSIPLDGISTGSISIPATYFYNAKSFSILGLDVAIPNPKIARGAYLDCIRALNFRLKDSSSGFDQPGDTHFPLVAPEPPHEDSDLLDKMLRQKIIDRKFAACLLMIDFPNPVFSIARKSLLKYVPAVLDNFSNLMIAAILRSPKENTPESEFAKLWNLVQQDGWEMVFINRIKAYLYNVQETLKTLEGLLSFVKLLEYRKYLFRKQPIYEFPLTLPTTDISRQTPPLEMTESGAIISIQNSFEPEVVRKAGGDM